MTEVIISLVTVTTIALVVGLYLLFIQTQRLSRAQRSEDQRPNVPSAVAQSELTRLRVEALGKWLVEMFLRGKHIDAGKPMFGTAPPPVAGPRVAKTVTINETEHIRQSTDSDSALQGQRKVIIEPTRTTATAQSTGRTTGPAECRPHEHIDHARYRPADVLRAISAGECIPDIKALRPYKGEHWDKKSTGYRTHTNSMTFQVRQPDGNRGVLKVYYHSRRERKRGYDRIDELRILKDPLSEYLCPGTYFSGGIKINGEAVDALLMPWIDGLTLNDFVALNMGKRHKLIQVAAAWRELVARMANDSYAHGDYCSTNMLVVENGSGVRIVLIDNDSFSWADHHIELPLMVGHASCQPPARLLNPELFADVKYVDRFSSLVIYIGIFAFTLDHIHDEPKSDDDGLLFTRSDLEHPEASQLFQWLCKVEGEDNAWLRRAADELRMYLEPDVEPGRHRTLDDVLHRDFSHES